VEGAIQRMGRHACGASRRAVGAAVSRAVLPCGPD
jgi:hypothetical protein